MLGFKTDEATYKIIKFSNKYRIMKEVVSGYLGLYRFRTDNNYDFSSRLLYKLTNEAIEVPNLTFKKAVSGFVSECPAVQVGVKDKTYKASNLEEMIAAFNNCLNDKPQVVTENTETKKAASKPSKELELIQAISKKLASENINEELSTLLGDLEDKVSKGEKVPGYLISALKENTGAYTSVEKEVTALIDLLQKT